jgi:hypothetical protein
MRITRGTVAGLSVAICLVFLGGARTAAAQSTPRLSGTYALRIERLCQPDFLGGLGTDPVDNDAAYFYFFNGGTFQNQIGVVNFNAKNLSMNGSTLKVKGDLLAQDLSGANISTTPTNPFTESSKAFSGTYSTTATTFTTNDTVSNDTKTYQAVYGAFAHSVAHIAFFETVFQDIDGNWCEQSGELQFK